MNDYNDLMNEYQDVKNEITQEKKNISNTLIRIKTFQSGIESLNNNIIVIPEQNQLKIFKLIDKNSSNFSNQLMSIYNLMDNQIIQQLNNLIESADDICNDKLKNFNNIKISLIQARQKLNKTKDDYFDFVSKNSKNKFNNEDEKLLYNAKKENYYQLYKYEVNQMNAIIEENNVEYEKMHTDLLGWKEIQQHKIKTYFLKFAKNIEKLGNAFIEYSKNIINDINEDKSDNIINEESKIKKTRFEKVKLEEEIIEEIQPINKDTKKDFNCIINESEFITPMGKNSDPIVNDDYFDFDIIDKDDFKFVDTQQKANTTKKKLFNWKKGSKNNSSKKLNNINENKKNLLEKKDKGKDNISNDASNNISSKSNDKKGLEFEIVDEMIKDSEALQKLNEKLINDTIKKITSDKELLTREVSEFMNLLKEVNPSTGKLYSYTFLTNLKKLNEKYIVNLKNGKNFIHLSNILNDISIKESNKIDILRLIIDISQIIAYKDRYLFNLLQRKNKYFSTKTFWSKIIMDSFINDLNNKTNQILETQNNNNENIKNKEKEKESNVYLLEFIHFSNRIQGYKKLNADQKVKLDKYARDNIINILTKGIEGMCSFLVQENIAMEVVSGFGRNFGFNDEVSNFYKLLIEVYINRNYIHNLKKLSLNDKSTEKMAKICIISNASKFLPKNSFVNLLILEKAMTKEIKNNIYRNQLLNPNLSIDERTRIWGLILNIEQIKKVYKYIEIREKILKSIENNEFPKSSRTFQNIQTIKLDVNRTFFSNKYDSKKHQECIKNVLLSIISTVKDIGYFQGMNYIAAFFYQIFGFDEEKTFYYMLAIEKNEKFKDLFERDLYLLQLYFKVFEKILKINIPEIYEHQMNFQVYPHFYLPPWFLTLFTFISTIFEKEKAPKFSILVIENFFLNGWSAIFNAGYTITKYHRYDIIKMKGDVLMDFMVNNFGQDEITNEDKFEIIKKEYIKNSYLINDSLISKLLKIVEYEKNNKK